MSSDEVNFYQSLTGVQNESNQIKRKKKARHDYFIERPIHNANDFGSLV